MSCVAAMHPRPFDGLPDPEPNILDRFLVGHNERV